MSTQDTRARLRYLVPGPERPVYYASQAGADAALNVTARFEDRELTIEDARALSPPPSLQREGFCLRAQHTAVDDFYALESQRDRYEVELTELVLAATGAGSALVFDHTLRSDSAAVRGARTTRETASLVHNDYSAASAAQRVRDLLPAEQAAARLQRRFAIVNAWRSVAGVVFHSPLAPADAPPRESIESRLLVFFA